MTWPKKSLFLIVDDHPVLRQGISAVLKSQFAGATVREADSYDQALELGEKSTPDVIVADPNLGGLDATTTVSKLRRGIGVPIVVFADNGDMRVLAQALKAGARACVRKDSSAEVLAEAIEVGPCRQVLHRRGAGRRRDLRRRGRRPHPDRPPARDPADVRRRFPHRKGRRRLGLSTETIRTHTKRILAKLNANTRTHAVAIAVRAQILD